jgi:carbamoyl-phosphate synthase small subunit
MGARLSVWQPEHHGMNHPIREIITDHIVFAFQGEGYVIRRNSVDRSQLFITYVDMLDGTVQGTAASSLSGFFGAVLP